VGAVRRGRHHAVDPDLAGAVLAGHDPDPAGDSGSHE